MIVQPQLPYENVALAPVISEETINYHYGKHEKAYVDNLNALIAGTQFENKPLEEIVVHSEGPTFNNASQAWNHIFYFFSFSPKGGGEIPEGQFKDKLVGTFGSIDEFKKQFEEKGVKLFGSGWVWLSKDANGDLVITQGSNAANPMKDGLKPILCFDVWEHAYYLDYQNRRAEYLHKLWDIVDWNIIQGRYLE